MRRFSKLIVFIRRNERLVVAFFLGMGVAAMVAHWWGTARLPPPAPYAPSAAQAQSLEATRERAQESGRRADAQRVARD